MGAFLSGDDEVTNYNYWDAKEEAAAESDTRLALLITIIIAALVAWLLGAMPD